MCQPKPGPRCSNHAQIKLDKAQEALDTLNRKELLDVPADKYEKVSADLNKRKEKAREDLRIAQHEYDSSPVGIERLEERTDALRKAVLELVGDGDDAGEVGELAADLKDTYGKSEAEMDGSSLKADSRWQDMERRRRALYTAYFQTNNRYLNAVENREYAQQELKAETKRKNLLVGSKYYVETKDVEGMDRVRVTSQNDYDNRFDPDAAERQSWKPPVRTTTPADEPDALEGSEQQEEEYNVEMSQGGKARITVKTYPVRYRGGYAIKSQAYITVTPEKAEADPATRKGFGNALNGEPEEATVLFEPTDKEDHVKEGMEFRVKQYSRYTASKAINEAGRMHDAQVISSMRTQALQR